MRHAEHRAIGDAGHDNQLRFDLGRVDVGAGRQPRPNGDQSPALSCSSDQPDQYQQDHSADNGVDDCGKDSAANQDSKLLQKPSGDDCADDANYEATLSQLLSFQLDRIKIDRSFVDRLGKSNDSAIIVRAILGLANGFGLAATAEGIEDAEQLATLKANGCQEGQGYLFEKAVPANEIPGVLEKINKLRIASPAKSGDDR
jgi:hypothetical protein